MERVAADGLVLVEQKDNSLSILEVNCETDFVAKNNDFINFANELSKFIGDEIAKTMVEQRALEGRYEQLIEERYNYIQIQI